MASSLPPRAPFRQEALDAYLAGEPEGGILCVAPPRAWILFCVLVAFVSAALAGSFVGRVEMTSRGRGILRPTGGVRLITTPIGGTVTEVVVASGDKVAEGQVLARLESASLEVELHETEERLQLARREVARFAEERGRRYDERASLLESEAGLVRRRLKSQDATIDRLMPRASSFEALRRDGLVTSQARDEVHELLEGARRQRIGLEEALSQNALQAATLRATKADELRILEQAVHAAQAKRDALALALDQTTIRAPQSGYIEAVLARSGDQLPAGAPVGKLLPSRIASQVVSFLPEKDRAFVHTGQRVRVEVDQLPYSEFGSLTARIERISEDLASPYEVKDAFGDAVRMEAAAFRVELALVEEETPLALRELLRPGMLADVRYTLRDRRVITIVLDPVRRWWN